MTDEVRIKNDEGRMTKDEGQITNGRRRIKKEMSATNYSKWDHIELSDDEDFDCHPNVDKSSMVRWKQAEIYRVRRERADKIEIINREISLNTSMLAQANDLICDDTLLDQLALLESKFNLTNDTFVKEMLEHRFRQRDARWRDPEPFTFCEQRISPGKYVNQLLQETKTLQARTDGISDLAAAFKVALSKLTNEIAKRKNQCEAEIENENKEANKKLTSENMYKEIYNTSANVGPKKTIETINSPSNVTAGGMANADQDTTSEIAESDHITSKAAQAFAELKNLQDSYHFLGHNVEIVNQTQSDEILAEAFRLQMRGGKDAKLTKQYIHQSLLLQYCALLGKDGVMMFFKRMETPGHSAKTLFYQDVESTYQKISERVKVLAQNEKEELELERQLGLKRVEAATQLDGSLALPREGDEEDIARADAFAELPRDLQYALLTQDVDEINAALEKLSPPESERFMKIASGAGLIEIQVE